MNTHKTGWYVIYSGGEGIENMVHFEDRYEAQCWAGKYCQNTRHRIVWHRGSK